VVQVVTNTFLNQLRINGNRGAYGDAIQIAHNDNGFPGSCLFYMKPAAPIDMWAKDYGSYTYMSTGANNNNPHHAIHSATSNKWYVSLSSGGTSELDIPSFKAERWTEVEIATLTSTNLMLSSTNDIDYVTLPETVLNNIDGVGIFIGGQDTGAYRITEIRFATGTLEDDYDFWTDEVGLYNENASKTNDLDSDGLVNVWEWGMGGNPQDSNDIGYGSSTNIITSYETGPTNYIVYVYPRKKNPRPDTFLSETADLILPPGYENQQSNYVINTLGNFQGDNDFQTVTNRIPTFDAQKFIKLNME
jgi:hypothetical protein